MAFSLFGLDRITLSQTSLCNGSLVVLVYTLLTLRNVMHVLKSTLLLHSIFFSIQDFFSLFLIKFSRFNDIYSVNWWITHLLETGYVLWWKACWYGFQSTRSTLANEYRTDIWNARSGKMAFNHKPSYARDISSSRRSWMNSRLCIQAWGDISSTFKLVFQ